MRKKGLRCVIAVMVAVVVGICSAGCAGKEKTFPTYGTDKSFYIAGWGSPYAAEEDYRLAKEAGINHFLVVEAYSPSGTFIPTDLLELNKGAGITTVMHTNNDYGKAVDGSFRFMTRITKIFRNISTESATATSRFIRISPRSKSGRKRTTKNTATSLRFT